MQRLIHSYKDLAGFTDFVNQSNLSEQSNCFIRIFTTVMGEEDSVDLAKNVKGLLPRSTILGATSAGLLVDATISENETIIIIDSYVNTSAQLKFFSVLDKTPKELAHEFYTSFSKNINFEIDFVHVLFVEQFLSVEQFLEEINKLTPVIKLVGGIVGGTQKAALPGFIFTEEGIKKNQMVGFARFSNSNNYFINTFTSFEVLSPQYTITKTKGSLIQEIEGEPAFKWLYNYLGIAEAKELVDDLSLGIENDYFTHFPLILDETVGCGRFTRYNTEHECLQIYHSTISKGTTFRVGYLNPLKTIQDVHDLCQRVLDTSIEEMFVYSCLFRMLYLTSCASWELSPFKKNNLCGLFTLGEIAFGNGKNHLHDGACVVSGLAEKENYIIPDILALEQSELIENEKNFFEKVKEKQKEHLTDKQQELFEKTSHFKKERIHYKNIDKNYKIPNLYQYEIDRKKFNYDKICISEIQTADAIIAFAGEEQYFESSRAILQQSVQAMNEKLPDWRVYVINYKTFAVVSTKSISNEEFIETTKLLHKQYEYSSANGLVGVIRFVVALDAPDLLGTASRFLYDTKDSQENYHVCDYSGLETEKRVFEELGGMRLLKRAIDNNTIQPYYQGLYNTETKKIDKYEALMRIVETDGKVYTPYSFLESAKKYKFYKRISRITIEKILNDFRYRPEGVSINLSIYDFSSEAFRTWFITQIKQFPDPKRIIIEFVETENYSILDVLFNFLDEIRSVGCKVAIDDFGAGYSTLATIVAIKPDFIKVDGTIIRDIINSSEKKIILETIIYLAKKLNVEIVAEFVENGEVADFLKTYGIKYLQGYHFAKPLPLDGIGKDY